MGIFRNKSERPAPASGLSIIAAGATVRGDLETNGTVRVEGTVEGHVRAEQQVLVARGALVHGDVDASEAIVGGMVQGAIRAASRVEIQSGGAVQGDITTKRIAVAEGASLNGRIRMGESELALQRDGEAGQRLSPTPSPPSMSRPSVPVARVAVPPHARASGPGMIGAPYDQR